MTLEELINLEIPFKKIDETTLLYVNAGLEWIKQNTFLEFDIENIETIKGLPSGVSLFLLKYFEIMNTDSRVISESIAGISQTFSTKVQEKTLLQYAKNFLGSYLKPRSKIIPCLNRWKE